MDETWNGCELEFSLVILEDLSPDFETDEDDDGEDSFESGGLSDNRISSSEVKIAEAGEITCVD